MFIFPLNIASQAYPCSCSQIQFILFNSSRGNVPYFIHQFFPVTSAVLPLYNTATNILICVSLCKCVVASPCYILEINLLGCRVHTFFNSLPKTINLLSYQRYLRQVDTRFFHVQKLGNLESSELKQPFIMLYSLSSCSKPYSLSSCSKPKPLTMADEALQSSPSPSLLPHSHASLFTLLQLCWFSRYFLTFQVRSCPRLSALAFSSDQNVLRPDFLMVCFVISFRPLLKYSTSRDAYLDHPPLLPRPFCPSLPSYFILFLFIALLTI